MTAPAVPPGGEELREELIAALGAPNSVTEWDVKKGYLDPEKVAQVALGLSAVRDALAAQEKVRWVEELVADMETAPRGEIMPVSGAAALIRSVIEGQP